MSKYGPEQIASVTVPGAGIFDIAKDVLKRKSPDVSSLTHELPVEPAGNYAPIEKPFVEGVATLMPEDLGVPFGLAVTQTAEGLSIRREGEKIDETRGLRLFIIPTEDLEQFYTTNPSSDQLYDWLKQKNNVGRIVALDGHGVEMPTENVTIIVKKVECERVLAAHGNKIIRNRWNVPDVARWEVTPTGIRERLTERVILWSGDADDPLNISLLLRDVVQVRLTEDPLGAYSDEYKMERRKRLESVKKEQSTHLPTGNYGEAELVDQRMHIVPNTNTVVMLRLREHRNEGGPMAPWFEAFIVRDSKRQYVFELRWRQLGVNSAGHHYYEKGVDGISMQHLPPVCMGKEPHIQVPLEEGDATFYDSAESPMMRRQLLKLTITKAETDAHDPIYRMKYLDGIEPGQMVKPLHPSSSAENIVLFQEGVKQLEKARVKEQEEENRKRKNEEEAKKQEKAQKRANLRKKQSTNLLFHR